MFARNLKNPRADDLELDRKSLASRGIVSPSDSSATGNSAAYCSFAYSALASFMMGMSGRPLRWFHLKRVDVVVVVEHGNARVTSAAGSEVLGRSLAEGRAR